MKVRGTEAIMECLLEQGVDTVFGYPGGTIINLYDELYRYRDRIKHVLTSHEQGASHAADGYARATGRAGVCFATSGPGATNITTGIATAYLDSSPVVFITCNVGESLLGKDAFQEVDITGIAMPITKATFLVRNAEEIPDIMRQAFAIALSGRPGPVLIDFLKNVTNPDVMIDYEFIPGGDSTGSSDSVNAKAAHGSKAAAGDSGTAACDSGTEEKSCVSTAADRHAAANAVSKSGSYPEVDSQDVNKLLEMIAESERPFLICGGGVVRDRADREFREFAEKIDAPVAITLMGGGGFPGDHPLTSGMIGMHGSVASNTAADECDLLIAVGSRFSDRVALNPKTFAANAKIVQIDIDRAEIDKNVLTDHHIIGSAGKVLRLLNAKLPQYYHDEWKEHILPMREPSKAPDLGRFTPQQILESIRTIAPKDAIFSTDVGQHQMWAIKYLHFSYPGQLLTSGGFGTMGFGMGAAIGASFGCPDKRVINITGDGCFRMNCNELSTVEHYGLPIVTVIFNNGSLGMVRQWQDLIYDKRYSETTLDRGPDFVKLAEAYGLKGYRVYNVEEMNRTFSEALKLNKACVIDCRIDINEMVSPMVAAGHDITDFLITEGGCLG